jgi:hypothetical protein
MPRSALVAITLARKPIAEGSIAENAVKYGTGPINIQATRIAASDGYQKAWDRPVSTNITSGTYVHGTQVTTDLSAYRPSGRWPANLVVQHTPSCRPDACDPSCAVADIDGQDPDNRPGSQFFLNLVGDGSDALPDELVAYLRRMVTVDGGDCLTVPDLDGCDLSGLPSDHHHAAIVRGEPTPDQAKDLLRTLRPGGHLFVAAPEHRPTGHVGACRVEDAGFEVRDAILWVRDAGHVHYVAKAATSEREAGLAHLPEKSFAPSGGAQNALAAAEEAGAGDEAEYGGEGDLGFNRITRRRNTHPTPKPKALMARLLRTVPSDRGPILDPFVGSGTTLIACLETGHDGIGIEREAEYLEIADARVRHWNAALAAWDAARIESEYVSTSGEDSEVDLNDFLGL